MKKRAAILLLCGALGLSVAACGAKGGKNDAAKDTEPAAGGTETAGAAEDTASSQTTETAETYIPAASKFDLNAKDYTTLCDYSAIPVTISGDYEVSEDDAQEYFKSWYESSGPFYVADETKTVVGAGDIVDVDYVGKLNGTAFDGGSAEHQIIDVDGNKSTTGSGYIPGFTDGLKGAKVGDTIDSDVTFPESYGNQDLAGKAVVFTFTVNSIQKAIPFDEVDDAAIKANAGSSGISTVAEMLGQIKDMLTSEAEYNKRYDTYKAVQDYLAENCTVEIPQDYLDARVADYRYAYVKQYCGGDETKLEDAAKTNSGMSAEELQKDWYVRMETSIRTEFIMSSIAQELEVAVVEEEFASYAQQMATNSGYGSVEALYAMYGFGDEAYGEKMLRRYYLCDAALDKLLETAVVTVEGK